MSSHANAEDSNLTTTTTTTAAASRSGIGTGKIIHAVRYTRAHLVGLRQEVLSRKRPESLLRNELQALGVWKYGGSVHEKSNGHSGSGSFYETAANGVQLTTRNLSRLSPGNATTTTTTTTNSANGGDNSLHQHAVQSPASMSSLATKSLLLDHRSISSSHLMPAFVKRRNAAAAAAAAAEEQRSQTPFENHHHQHQQRQQQQQQQHMSPQRHQVLGKFFKFAWLLTSFHWINKINVQKYT